MKIVTNADFKKEVLKSDKPVLVDFFATWCPPCKAISPYLEEIAKEKADSLKIVKVDVDASPDIAAQYSIRSMPTLLMIRGGDVISSKIGGAPKSELVAWIDEALALPAGTKVDLAPKVVSLSDSDKKKLRKVFAEAVNKSPDADIPTTVLTADGSETTLRKAIEKELNDGSLFKGVEALLTQTEMPLKEYIKAVKKQGLALPKPPQA